MEAAFRSSGLAYVFIGLAAVGCLSGCWSGAGGGAGTASFGGGSSGAEFGATQGGVQDMGFARELIAAGQVPPPEAFLVEGMFSEHDLGLAGEPCDTTLCLDAALGVAPTVEGTASGWLQVGLSSSIDPDTFERPSLTLIATVDVSGSMGWRYLTEQSESPTPGDVSRDMLSEIAGELDQQDQIAIVTYGSRVNTVLGFTSGADQTVIQAAIDGLSEAGSTNMEGGMRQAYDLARVSGAQTDEVRVMVFTDVQPNVGATTASEFEQLAQQGAEDDIGLTVMAVGLGLGQEVLNGMAQVRGGNAFSLFDHADVDELMEDSWPWMISPIAYDMSVELTPAAGFVVADTYGFPAAEEGEMPALDVATLFLSRRKGALLIRLTPEQGDELGGLSVASRLTYTTPEGQDYTENIEVAYNDEELDERGQYFQQESVGKTVALALLVEAMHDAAEQYAEDQQAAVDIMTAALERFSADAEALDDEALTPEVDLANELLRLMEEGAEQGDLYDYGIW